MSLDRIAIAFFLIIVSCGQTAEPATNTPQNAEPTNGAVDVTIEGFAFNPPIVTIKAGESVRWTNKDSIGHTATGEGFDTGVLKQGESGTIKFDKPGTYSYICTPHPNMKAKVVVR